MTEASVMEKLRGTVDCSGVLPGTVEYKAVVGDLAVARMRTKNWDERFVVGVVTAANDDGSVKTIATARHRPSWEYDAQAHVGDQAKLRGRTAVQLALEFPQAFPTYGGAYAAVCIALGLDVPSEPGDGGDPA